MKHFSKISSVEEAKDLYRQLARKHHPDVGGDTELMQEINSEFAEALKFVAHRRNSIINESASDFINTVYDDEGFKGSRYNPDLRNKDIAKVMRDYVKVAWPTCKFSIRADYLSIYISLMEAPRSVWSEDHADADYFQVNQFYIESSEYLNDLGKAIMKDVYSMLLSYNRDDSDIQSDYFSTNFYTHLNVGKWDKPFKVVARTARLTGLAQPLANA